MLHPSLCIAPFTLVLCDKPGNRDVSLSPVSCHRESINAQVKLPGSGAGVRQGLPGGGALSPPPVAPDAAPRELVT